MLPVYIELDTNETKPISVNIYNTITCTRMYCLPKILEELMLEGSPHRKYGQRNLGISLAFELRRIQVRSLADFLVWVQHSFLVFRIRTRGQS